MSPHAEPSLAVVVPALDEAEEIEATLDSIRGAADEVVVVDGGSSDGTPERAAARGARVIASPPGRAAQMNRGAAETRADVLLFLHADTRLPEGWQFALREAIRSGAVAGRFDVELRSDRPLLRLVAKAINARSRATRISTGDQAIFVRRSVFVRIGGYEAVPLMEDVALCRRLKREGAFASLRAMVSTSARRWETHGVVRTIILMWSLRLAYWAGVPPQRLATLYHGRRKVRPRPPPIGRSP